MIIELPEGPPPRDPGTLDYSDITTTPFLGATVSTEDSAYVLEFDGDLTPSQVRRVILRALSTATEQQIQDAALRAFAANKAFLALNPPTNAQILAQVRLLTREVNGLLRLVLGQTEDASDV